MNISWAESKLKIGEKAYVWARNGIWLREEPSIDAKTVEELAYGTHLKILSDGIGSYKSLVKYGQQDSTTSYSTTGAWRKVKIESTHGGNKEGYVFDGWLLSLPPLKCEIKMGVKKRESERSCESIINWGTRSFGLVNKKKISSDGQGCNGCVTRYLFGKGFIYEEYEPGYGSEDKLTMPGFNLSEGIIAALGLFAWWDEEKPRIEISEKRVSFFGTYQRLVVELSKGGVKITDWCRDC